MRTTAEIVHEATAWARSEITRQAQVSDPEDAQRLNPLKFMYLYGTLCATKAAELAQADAAALLEPVRMRRSDGGVRQ